MDEVRHAVGMARVVEEHVALKRVGRTLKGLCPFHAEKSPSFHVDDAKGFYHCFGCGAGGDVFSFVMRHDGLTFPEAVRLLADKGGVRLPERRKDSPEDAIRDVIVSINKAAQELFQEALAGRGKDAQAANAYLDRRGLDAQVIAGFGVGWAPESWDFLERRLSSRFSTRELLASGLLVEREGRTGVYDRFRGRVTFPIRAVSERVVGFGGRLIADGEPKYLNSPETPLYTKGRHLFALDHARAAIRRTGVAVLVEGYLDAISLHARGVDNAVAVLGTALTPEQARLLSRHAKRVVLNFDGDTAGVRAARRSIEVLLAEGLEVRVLELPVGADPDDHVRAVGGEAYRLAVDKAAGFFDFLLRRLRQQHDVTTPTGKLSALNELLPLIVGTSDRLLREQLEDAACEGLGIRSGAVREEVRRAVRKGATAVQPPAAPPDASHAESTLISWLLADERARETFRGLVADDALARLDRAAIFDAILAEPPGQLRVSSVLQRLGDDWQRQLVSRCAVDPHREPVDSVTLEAVLRACLGEMGLSVPHEARRRKLQVQQELVEAVRNNDHDAVRRLAAEAHELARAIHA